MQKHCKKIFSVQILVLLLLSSFFEISAQKVEAYQIFTAKGKKVHFEEMISQLKDADILLFGELHSDPIIHWLQYETAKALDTKRRLVFGAEMFEADNQEGLNQYLKGNIEADSMAKVVRLWNNFKTDYKKMVDLAKEKSIPFIATNIPRKYASKVFRHGFEVLDTLPDNEKAWIAPLPIQYDPEVACYKNMMDMDMGGHAPTENFPKAQAIKDATMAYFTHLNFVPGTLFIHLNGTYHSDNYEGILWYLKKHNAKLKYKTISAVQQKQVNKLDIENLGKGDFIICVDEDMTTTY